MQSAPKWWLLGDAAFREVTQPAGGRSGPFAQLISSLSRPTTRPVAEQLVVVREDPSMLRARLDIASFDVREGSLTARRRMGQSARSRQTELARLQEAQAEHDRAVLQAKGEAVQRASITANTSVPVSTSTIGAASTVETPGAASGRKRPRTKEAGDVAKAAKAVVEEQKKKEKRPEPCARVEVALNFDGLAKWYEAQALQETKTRTKVSSRTSEKATKTHQPDLRNATQVKLLLMLDPEVGDVHLDIPGVRTPSDFCLLQHN